MKKSAFFYHLPEELIAQTPAEPRDSARLLCMDRRDGSLQHTVFHQLPALLRAGDLLVVNNSRVLPARLLGHRPGSEKVCELLLLRQLSGDEWECLARPGKKLKPGAVLHFGDGTLHAEILETLENGGKRVRFTYDTSTLYEKLDAFGRMPLPPYIKQQDASRSEDYQTVYAKERGSAAAPTAGLHFTPQLMDRLREAGVGFAEVTLHVGLGTFRPVQEDEIEDHTMHSEWFTIDEEAARAVRETKAAGGRVIAVGTTSCRVLESVAQSHCGTVQAYSGDTDIFLRPGAEFLAIDGLITNFHLPESTLLMLVSAFCGRENTLHAYEEAIREKYRFFSFGDAMLIL